MTGKGDLVLEHLKEIQAELSASRERDSEMLSRLGHLEVMMARSARDNASVYAELVEDRHATDSLRERIERRLELDA